jgi:hypothetical protein
VLLQHLLPGQAAIVAFALATSAESIAISRAMRSDIPENLEGGVTVRGSKTPLRFRVCPVVTEEQRLLLSYVPDPLPGPTMYLVNGEKRTLNDWAKQSAIPKGTLHHRVVVRGLSMEEALALGRGRRAKSVNCSILCRTGAADSMAAVALLGHPEPPANDAAPAKQPEKVVGRKGIEPLTYGLKVRSSAN